MEYLLIVAGVYLIYRWVIYDNIEDEPHTKFWMDK